MHRALYLPISANGEICAVIQVSSLRQGERDEGEMTAMTAIAIQIGQFVERRRCEERIRESDAWKTAMLEASLDAVITIDAGGRVFEFNSVAERTFGYRRVDIVGRQLVDLIVPPKLRERAMSSLAHYRTTGESGLIGQRVDVIAMRSDGTEFPIEVAVTRVAVDVRPMLTLHMRDATARKLAEEEVANYQRRLRSLTAELLLAEELERRKLSIDLHDGLSQTIALAQLKLGLFRRSTDTALSTSLDEIEGLIDQAHQTARSITFELSPPVLHDLGLEPAVHWLVENIQARYGIETAFEDDGQLKPADEKTRVILFRAIRELLINAAKHANPRRVHVKLNRVEDCVCAAVVDDGIGMEAPTAAIKGSGLFSIRERLT
jgi:PAS domain S-box-containing protein